MFGCSQFTKLHKYLHGALNIGKLWCMVGISSFATKQKQHIYWCLASITSPCRGAGDRVAEVAGWCRQYAALYCYCYGCVMNIPNCLWSTGCIITLYRTGPYNSGGGAHALLITPCLVIVMLHIINTLSTAELPRTGDTWQHGTQGHNRGEKTVI